MHSMLQFSSVERQSSSLGSASRAATTSSRGRYRYHTGARHGGGGYTVVDDDDWQTRSTFDNLLPAAATDMSNNFPTLPQSASAHPVSASASPAKTLWSNAKALGAVKNAPESSRLKKAEMNDSCESEATEATQQQQTWRSLSPVTKWSFCYVCLTAYQTRAHICVSDCSLTHSLGWYCSLALNWRTLLQRRWRSLVVTLTNRQKKWSSLEVGIWSFARVGGLFLIRTKTFVCVCVCVRVCVCVCVCACV